MSEIVIAVGNEAETALLAADAAMAAARSDCLLLSGNLGAGKSTFARAFIRAFTAIPHLEVPSPTFTLVQTYEARIPISHFDLYRISEASELDELGFDEALGDGIVLVEWPEKADSDMPKDGLRIRFEGTGSQRTITVTGSGPSFERFERSRTIRKFLDENGFPEAVRAFFQGDASARAYETVESTGQAPAILMNAPRRPDGPPVRNGLPYSQIAHLAEDVVPFVAIAARLKALGFAAPAIPAQDLENGLLIVEDLGRDGVLDENGRPRAECYEAAIDVLAALHETPLERSIHVRGKPYVVPHYDEAALAIETELLTDWYLPWKRGEAASDEERARYQAVWKEPFAFVREAEQALVLRDYHSPNLIWRPEEQGLHRIGIIDFQDALIGPSAYDVASLVQDARVDVDPALASDLLARYEAQRASANPAFDRDAFRAAYAVMAAQRSAKLYGIFVRLKVRDGKPGYIRHLPRIERHMHAVIDHAVLAPVRAWLADAGLI